MASNPPKPQSATQTFTDWTFGELPELMEIQRGGHTLIGFPALIDKGQHVEIDIFDEPDVAAAKHRAGLRRLVALQIKEPLKYLEKLEARVALLLDQSPEPETAMSMLDAAANEGGLLQASIKTRSPAMFAGQMLTGNPAALDWINAKVQLEAMPPHPDRLESLDEIASALRPSPN